MRLTASLRRWLADLAGMALPTLCEVCGEPLVDGESVMCTHCRLSMPLVRIADYGDNEMHLRVAAPGQPVERCGSYFYYLRDGSYAALIHATKYHGRPRVGRQLAAELGRRLHSAGFFDGIDTIVPVPIHPLKRLKRSYNQSEWIARGLSDVSGRPVVSRLLSARRSHGTQTRKSTFDRWLNSRDTYAARRLNTFTGKHILLVDDVMTTGATLLACARALREVYPDIRISIATLALTTQ